MPESKAPNSPLSELWHSTDCECIPDLLHTGNDPETDVDLFSLEESEQQNEMTTVWTVVGPRPRLQFVMFSCDPIRYECI